MSEKRDSILSDEVADIKWSAFADQGHNEWETKGLPCDERSWRHGWRSAGWHLDDLIKKGDLIRRDELVAWLDRQIYPGDTGWNAAMEAVKAHVQG